MYFEYFIIGIIQGLTEFLPVSSSGHVVLFGKIFGMEGDILLLNIIVHLGTLIAVVIVEWKQILELIKNPLSTKMLQLVVATVISVIIILLLNSFMPEATGLILGICFIITAILLLIASFVKPKDDVIDHKTSCIMGIAQGLAVIPGISRSGASIVAGMFCGKEQKSVTNFSFLMSIPIIICSAIWECIDLARGGAVNVEWLPLIVAFIASFIAGILSIKFMYKLIKHNKLWCFSIYLVILAVLVFIFV